MLLLVLFCLLTLIKCHHAHQTSWNSNYEYNNRHKVPQDVMVDAVNSLALKLLAIHNEGNNNNIAISPYGALSVLVALGEGLRGDALYEVQRAANIPSDISVVRVGLRDIHRHLKSYFIPEEGFLSGLTLSHDNVTLNREYEDILKFYGYDVNSFNNALYPGLFTTTEESASTGTTETSTESTIVTEPAASEREGNDEITTEMATPSTTVENDRMTRSEITRVPTQSAYETTVAAEITTLFTSGPLNGPSVANTAEAIVTSTENVITSSVGTESSPSTSQNLAEANRFVDDNLGTTVFTESTTMVQAHTTTDNAVDSSEITITTDNARTTTTEAMTDNSEILGTSTVGFDGTTESTAELSRPERSVVDYVIARYYDDRTVTQRPPPYQPEKDLYFLVDGKNKEYNINYMTYDTVLPFSYISHLNALALQFPLDSDKYYLLLLLPESEDGLEKLICDLRLNGNLKYIISQLRYTHVKAIIPSFMLKGIVMLTSTFQKMGIRRVFEPRQADFSPMTADRNIYVTNIEQAITVNIRNYVDSATMNSNKYLHHNNPILFTADHPFLYFVIDSEIGVTLMAGKVVNPLNSRIR